MIIPSIDIMGGRAVQLRQGRQLVLTSEKSPLELAKEFNRYGEVAVIDLDAALGQGDNRQLVKDLCRVADVRAGGGIRDVEAARDLLRAGAKKVIIGTAAEPELLSRLPADRVMVALDQVDGKVVDNGWRSTTGESVLDRAKRLSPYCSSFLSTFVKGEGCMEGIDEQAVVTLRDGLDRPLTIAGGVASTSDAVTLSKLGVDVQVGMALYKGELDLGESFIKILKWGADGLIPTVVQDIYGNVLMLAYSSKDSLIEALTCGTGTYYSRSRKEIWRKGATSGNLQQLLSCRADCDNDAITFTVEQNGVACHSGSYTCFNNSTKRPFDIEKLFDVIAERQKEANVILQSASVLEPEMTADNLEQEKSANTLAQGKAGVSVKMKVTPATELTYTQKLLTDRTLLNKKIMEEAYEVVSYSSRENLKWEIADLLYFVSVLASAEGISWQEIENELGGRRK